MSFTTLLLDGIWGRPRRLRPLRQTIAERCGPTEIYKYDCTGRCCIETLGADLAAEIRKRNTPVNLVGFSMGGLVIRAAHLHDPTLPIRRAAFLNSPHQGSWLAHVLSLPAVKDMRPGSDLLIRLESAPWTIPTLCVWCSGDAMVLPNSSANWSQATESIHSRVPAHIWPIYSPGLHRRVAEFLAFDTELAHRYDPPG